VPMAARRRGHVATRVFQALRIEVNQEAEQLAAGSRRRLTCSRPPGVSCDFLPFG